MPADQEKWRASLQHEQHEQLKSSDELQAGCRATVGVE